MKYAINIKNEIKENDYNLNIPRYVDVFEEEEEIDLDAVQAELEKIGEEDKKVTEEQLEIMKYNMEYAECISQKECENAN